MEKILVIDDDPDIIALMRIVLQKKEYSVATATRENEVYEMIERFQPDLILLDVLLSGSDGRKICRKIKEEDLSKNIPVIMFSAHPGAQKNFNEYGADDFISKPFHSSALLEKIQFQLSRRQQQID